MMKEAGQPLAGDVDMSIENCVFMPLKTQFSLTGSN